MNIGDGTLIVGAGIAGMQAALMLAKTGKTVYLVEKLPLIGGNAIKNEESFPNLECSTCMVAPMQQEVLQHQNIKTMTLSTVEEITGKAGSFKVKILQKARYVSLADCIGCGMCYEPCPVTLVNEWEESLGEKKAIYVPCAGSLPNVPAVDALKCLQLTGTKECNACVEACMFGAIDLSDQDKIEEIQVGAIILATGSDLFDVSNLTRLGYGHYDGVYTAMEFERLFSSNGPTEGELTIRNSDKNPESVAIIHCVGRKEQGYCSGICCLYSLKHSHFIKHKLPTAKIYNIYSDLCLPGKVYEKFYNDIKREGNMLVFNSSPEKLRITGEGDSLQVIYENAAEKEESIEVDMVILAPAVVPGKDLSQLCEIVGIDRDEKGFIQAGKDTLGSTATSKEGIFAAGCAEGPKDIQASVSQAESAAGKVISLLN